MEYSCSTLLADRGGLVEHAQLQSAAIAGFGFGCCFVKFGPYAGCSVQDDISVLHVHYSKEVLIDEVLSHCDARSPEQ